MQILILGGGPCGLGAAWRLMEQGHTDWQICEQHGDWGGLSTSFQDPEGFWWDIGGHVLFSHYRYFDGVMDRLFDADAGWHFHEREAWIWMQNRFIPYPLQNNIHLLPPDVYWECLKGVIDIHNTGARSKPRHFGDWIDATFGTGIAKWFLNPYNSKVWAYPREEMGWSWVGERVSPVGLEKILKNAVFNKVEKGWGPNALFRFPKNGATGSIWRAIASRIPDAQKHLHAEATGIDPTEGIVRFSDGSARRYDLLISTLPVTRLVDLMRSPPAVARQVPGVGSLKWSGVHVVGLGLKGTPPDHLATKCWIYFPESDCPFYRVTVFSNYATNNVPDASGYWSLMAEVSESPVKPVAHGEVVSGVIQGALNTGLIDSRRQIHHTWHHVVPFGYPTPSVHRDAHLFPLLLELETHGICSRGRFGAWRYEVGNMDHSFMQGVEAVDAILSHGEELTLWYPGVVNAAHPSGRPR